MTTEQFDYVVVGGGSAGCAVANRPSESGRCSVLLLQVGPERRGNAFVNMPPGFPRPAMPAGGRNLHHAETPGG